MSARFEVDDRGVATVPTACGWNGENEKKDVNSQLFGTAGPSDGDNIGTGTISDVSYSENKFQEIEVDQTWSITYYKKTNTFHVWGSMTCVTGQGDSRRRYTCCNGILSTGHQGNQTWSIDLEEDYGWGVVISEGNIPFENGDQFAFFSHKYVDGRVYIVKGRGFSESPVLKLDSNYLRPSYVIEALVKEVLELKHENIAESTPNQY